MLLVSLKMSALQTGYWTAFSMAISLVSGTKLFDIRVRGIINSENYSVVQRPYKCLLLLKTFSSFNMSYQDILKTLMICLESRERNHKPFFSVSIFENETTWYVAYVAIRLVSTANNIMSSQEGVRVKTRLLLPSAMSASKEKRIVEMQATAVVIPTSSTWIRCDGVAPTLNFSKWMRTSWLNKPCTTRLWAIASYKPFTTGRVAAVTHGETRLFHKLQTMSVEPCLTSWFSKHSSRGTERRVLKRKPCKRIRDRNSKLLDHRQLVLSNQGKLNDEQLRNKSLKLLRKERVFARMMGIADAVSVDSEISPVSSASPVPACSQVKVKADEVLQFFFSSGISLLNLLYTNHKMKRVASKQHDRGEVEKK